MTPAPRRSPSLSPNPFAHPNPRVRLLNSALLLGALHIALFVVGNENATPLRLLLSFSAMMGVLFAVATFRSWRSRAAAALAHTPPSPLPPPPGAAP